MLLIFLCLLRGTKHKPKCHTVQYLRYNNTFIVVFAPFVTSFFSRWIFSKIKIDPIKTHKQTINWTYCPLSTIDRISKSSFVLNEKSWIDARLLLPKVTKLHHHRNIFQINFQNARKNLSTISYNFILYLFRLCSFSYIFVLFPRPILRLWIPVVSFFRWQL